MDGTLPTGLGLVFASGRRRAAPRWLEFVKRRKYYSIHSLDSIAASRLRRHDNQPLAFLLLLAETFLAEAPGDPFRCLDNEPFALAPTRRYGKANKKRSTYDSLSSPSRCPRWFSSWPFFLVFSSLSVTQPACKHRFVGPSISISQETLTASFHGHLLEGH